MIKTITQIQKNRNNTKEKQQQNLVSPQQHYTVNTVVVVVVVVCDTIKLSGFTSFSILRHTCFLFAQFYNIKTTIILFNNSLSRAHSLSFFFVYSKYLLQVY